MEFIVTLIGFDWRVVRSVRMPGNVGDGDAFFAQIAKNGPIASSDSEAVSKLWIRSRATYGLKRYSCSCTSSGLLFRVLFTAVLTG